MRSDRKCPNPAQRPTSGPKQAPLAPGSGTPAATATAAKPRSEQGYSFALSLPGMPESDLSSGLRRSMLANGKNPVGPLSPSFFERTDFAPALPLWTHRLPPDKSTELRGAKTSAHTSRLPAPFGVSQAISHTGDDDAGSRGTRCAQNRRASMDAASGEPPGFFYCRVSVGHFS